MPGSARQYEPTALSPRSHYQQPPSRAASGRSRYAVLLVALFIGLSLVAATTFIAGSQRVTAQPLPALSPIVDPALQEAMGLAQEGQPLRVIVRMQGPVGDPYSALPQSVTERRLALVRRLQQKAADSQADILFALQHSLAAGVSFYRSLWIINAIQVTADRETITTLAARRDVARISLDAAVQLLNPLAMAAEVGDPELPWHLQRTRVQHVWAGLGITGTGATIAIMDTGVDWQHPALADTYLGLGVDGSLHHELAWFDAVDASPEPIDPHGHGTHVAGTASGRLGIGAAPGSRWMAVRILRSDGTGLSGDIHAGFQWLLAPGGDPLMAPDIVNGSWSGSPEFVEFMPDIEALHAAGVITVFAAGNSGPESGSVGAPADYPGVIAVGATDDIDQVAWFSSRGPSILTSEVKPTISAPGLHILSALPGGAYGYNSGTSMAAPHVAGIYALLLSADPGLDAAGATAILTATAQATAGTEPNADVGWGLVDAYDALASIVPSGSVVGAVTGDGLPLPGAQITLTTPAAVQLRFEPAADGSFQASLISGTYGITVNAFGYAPKTSLIEVKTGLVSQYVADLARLPFGKVEGQLRELGSSLPLSGTIQVTGVPVTATVPGDGRYSFELPAGAYQLVPWVRGHRLERQTITVTAALTIEHDIWLAPGPDVLLVDSGKWYGGSQIAPYANALEANDFSYELHTIRDPYSDSPTQESLSQYDAVIWSVPRDSPGATDSGDLLSAYLDSGGNVLISGHNAAGLDQGQYRPQRWWLQQLRGIYLGKSQPPFNLQGEPATVFGDLQLALVEMDESGNPILPDASAPAQSSLTQVGLRYADGEAASLFAGQCAPYRLVYFGFGLEDVAESEARTQLITSTFQFFNQPETEFGLKFGQESIDDLIPSGSSRSYPVTLLNLSEVHTDTVQLAVSDATWSARVLSDTVVLGPCQSATTAVEVDVPSGLPLDTAEGFQLIAHSSVEPGYSQTMTFRLKTPGHILLVDDSRWYDQSATFKAAMTGAGFTFDFLKTSNNDTQSSSPPQDLLNAYDFIVWYTAYDWFRPITAAESEALEAYLAQGGRLFLTSQDYLFRHPNDPLTRNYLGVLHFAESVTPTVVYGAAAQEPFGDIGGPQPLSFGLYQNHGDGLVAAPGAQVSLWSDAGYPAGLASAGADWRTVFWAIPLETLPGEIQAQAMNRNLGWLSDLGQSTFTVGGRTSLPGHAQAYTLTLRYSATGPGSKVAITNSVPVSLAVDAASLTGQAQYDSLSHQIIWTGVLSPGQEHVISYQATPSIYLVPGERLENKVEIHYEDHDLTFARTVRSWIAAPDLTPTSVHLSAPWVRPGEVATVELQLVNSGLASNISADLRFPAETKPLTGTVTFSAGDIQWSRQQLTWSGWLEPGQIITASVLVTTSLGASPDWLPFTVIMEDGLTDPVIVSSWLEVRPYTRYLPFIAPGRP